MVVYDLNCASGHLFEGWFRSSEAFDEQLARGLLTCPECRSGTVTRRPSASRIRRGGGAEPDPGARPAGTGNPVSVEHAGRMMLQALRHFVEKNFEDVGPRFAGEARRMHHGEAAERNIRGTATVDEVRELHDEGIDAKPLPGPDVGKPN